MEVQQLCLNPQHQSVSLNALVDQRQVVVLITSDIVEVVVAAVGIADNQQVTKLFPLRSRLGTLVIEDIWIRPEIKKCVVR